MKRVTTPILSNLPGSWRGSAGAVAILVLAAVLSGGGCAGSNPPAVDQARTPTHAGSGEPEFPPRTNRTTTGDGEPDGALELTAEPDVELALDASGRAPLEALEQLSRTALALIAEDRLDEAEDHLFVLDDQASRPAPSDTDSLYVAQQLSLERRAGLMAAILAEQSAFGGDPAQADSMLADSYARLAQTTFPDSLVPATGAKLSAITVDLLKVDNHEVNRWVNYFSGRGRDHFQVWLERRAEVDSLITAILDENGLPRELIYLAIIESGLSPRAVSNASAVGPWQFMAPTGRAYGLQTDWWVDERRDMEMSTRAACKYVRNLYTQFNDWALVLAAYNTGEGRVERVINQTGHDDFWNLRLPSQTTAHIPKFIAAARIGEDPARYGFNVPAARPLHYDILPVDGATDLDVIAKCAGADGAEIKLLNPGLVRGITPPEHKAYPVKVPAGTGAAAKVALAKVPPEKRLTWSRHRVERGETLGRIAANFGSSVADIARLNKLSTPYLIHPGDELLIPMPGDLSDKARQRLESAPTKSKSKSGKAVTKAKGRYEPPAGWERFSYDVRRGDTVGGIAKKMGVTVSHLRVVNGLPRNNLIRVGQRLFAYKPPKG